MGLDCWRQRKVKDFKEEFNKYLTKLKDHEPFAFSRWAGGELWILENKSYSLSPTTII